MCHGANIAVVQRSAPHFVLGSKTTRQLQYSAEFTTIDCPALIGENPKCFATASISPPRFTMTGPDAGAGSVINQMLGLYCPFLSMRLDNSACGVHSGFHVQISLFECTPFMKVSLCRVI